MLKVFSIIALIVGSIAAYIFLSDDSGSQRRIPDESAPNIQQSSSNAGRQGASDLAVISAEVVDDVLHEPSAEPLNSTALDVTNVGEESGPPSAEPSGLDWTFMKSPKLMSARIDEYMVSTDRDEEWSPIAEGVLVDWFSDEEPESRSAINAECSHDACYVDFYVSSREFVRNHWQTLQELN